MSTFNPRGPTAKGFENFVECGRCGTSIPDRSAIPVAEALGRGKFNCRDVWWCARQARTAVPLTLATAGAPEST